MNTEITKVKVKYGTSEQLAKAFRVTTRSVGNALSGRSNSEIARKIRVAAVKAGGDPIYKNTNN
ncbi:MAG: hypothetical protein FWC34_09195 [Bacteroidetes bacterium]|nr:hypothetical protein [Bacteroidota bacterium]MCL2303026.1 hypothetical protein [Lentimicrobiaceae bacterium]